MRRVLLAILLSFIFFAHSGFVLAQSPALTPSPLPSGAALSVEGVLIPGVTCGVANDPDPGKSKCCVPKKRDEGLLVEVGKIVSVLPIVGDFFVDYSEKYTAISGLATKMDPCVPGEGVAPSTTDLTDKSCICIREKDATSSAILELNSFCKKYFPVRDNTKADYNSELQKCSRCMMQTGGFYTALGCMPLDMPTFISQYILALGIGLAGGVALLCILYSAFRMQTSMGNAEAIKKAQENMTACITGLIVIIFSVLILRIIGVDILRIPGFLP